MTEYTCKLCSRKFTNSQSLNSHVRHCRLAQEGKTWFDTSTPSTIEKFQKLSEIRSHARPKCLVCGKECKELGAKFCSSGCSHVGKKYHHGQPRSESTKQKIRESTLKTLGDRTLSYKNCVICGNIFKPRMKISTCCSRKCGGISAGIANKGKKRPGQGGGYREGSERAKSGWYKGFYCGSTYELIFLIYHLERGIGIRRSSASLPYEFEGRVCHYHPDFEVERTIYEIKGYSNAKAEAKKVTFPEIVIIGTNKIKEMQNNCSLAGKNITELVKMYDRSNVAFTQCAACGRDFCKLKKTSKYCCRQCCEDVQFKKKPLFQLTPNAA
jgi:hypothetical protein